MVRFIGFPFEVWNFIFLGIPLVIFLGWMSYRKRKQALLDFSEIYSVRNKGAFFNKWKRRAFLAFLIIIILILGLLRPQIMITHSRDKYRGSDVVLVVDVSLSMGARDGNNYTRLDLVKEKVTQFSKEMAFRRVSVVIFSGESFAWLPFLTDDAYLIEFFSDRLESGFLTKRGTDIPSALHKAVMIMDKRKEERKGTILLLSDGELYGVDVASLRNSIVEIRRRGYHLYTLGVGSKEGSKIPKLNEEGEIEGWVGNGEVAFTRLNEENLKLLAQSCKDKYKKLTPKTNLVNFLSSEKELVGKEKIETWITLYQPILILAFLLMLLFLI